MNFTISPDEFDFARTWNNKDRERLMYFLLNNLDRSMMNIYDYDTAEVDNDSILHGMIYMRFNEENILYRFLNNEYKLFKESLNVKDTEYRTKSNNTSTKNNSNCIR